MTKMIFVTWKQNSFDEYYVFNKDGVCLIRVGSSNITTNGKEEAINIVSFSQTIVLITVYYIMTIKIEKIQCNMNYLNTQS